MSRCIIHTLVALVFIVFPRVTVAAVIDFDSLSDSEAVVDQFAGLTFSNATLLTSGISLNEFEFPPNSGTNVVFDDGGPMRIDFASPMASVGAYATYGTALTLAAFDSGDTLLGSVSSLFASNLALSGEAGSSPNEFLSFAGAGISYVIFSADMFGSSFVLDDLTYDAGQVVPEPSTLMLAFVGGLATLKRLRRRIG